jgi:hypothetical protein
MVCARRACRNGKLRKRLRASRIGPARSPALPQAVPAAAWPTVAAAHAKDLRVTAEGLTHSRQVSLEAKLLEPKDALTSFDGLSTDEFVR